MSLDIYTYRLSPINPHQTPPGARQPRPAPPEQRHGAPHHVPRLSQRHFLGRRHGQRDPGEDAMAAKGRGVPRGDFSVEREETWEKHGDI